MRSCARNKLSGAAIVSSVATSAGGGTEGYLLPYGVLALIAPLISLIALALRNKT